MIPLCQREFFPSSLVTPICSKIQIRPETLINLTSEVSRGLTGMFIPSCSWVLERWTLWYNLGNWMKELNVLPEFYNWSNDGILPKKSRYFHLHVSNLTISKFQGQITDSFRPLVQRMDTKVKHIATRGKHKKTLQHRQLCWAVLSRILSHHMLKVFVYLPKSAAIDLIWKKTELALLEAEQKLPIVAAQIWSGCQ